MRKIILVKSFRICIIRNGAGTSVELSAGQSGWVGDCLGLLGFQ